METLSWRIYSRQFKKETVLLVEQGNKPLQQIARELGIPNTTLSHWRRQFATPGYIRLCDWCHQPLPPGVNGNRKLHAQCRVAKRRAKPRNPEQERKYYHRWAPAHRAHLNAQVRAKYHRYMADPQKRATYNERMCKYRRENKEHMREYRYAYKERQRHNQVETWPSHTGYCAHLMNRGPAPLSTCRLAAMGESQIGYS